MEGRCFAFLASTWNSTLIPPKQWQIITNADELSLGSASLGGRCGMLLLFFADFLVGLLFYLALYF